MIEKIVILRITRAAFGKREPVEVMVGFFDSQGRLVGSQLLSAELFDDDVSENQSVDFKNPFLRLSTE